MNLFDSAVICLRRAAFVPAVLLLGSGCAYFNTYYNAQSLFKDGVGLKEQKQVAQAKAKFEKSIEKSALVISRWPRSAWVDDASFLVGMSYFEMGHYDKAARHFEQLSIAFPGSAFAPRAELYRGLALLKDREFGVASVLLEDVRRKHPTLRDEATFSLAAALYEREDYDRAVDSLSAFVERFPRSSRMRDAVELLSDACFRLGRWAEAERWYKLQAGRARRPQDRARARLNVASALLEQGKAEQAAQEAREVIGRYRELDEQANLLLGRALYAIGRDREALETWSKVRGASDAGAEAFFRIGRHHEERKEFILARAHYDTARSRRANSDFGVQAVKRMSLLDALAKGASTGREPAEARFLLAELHNLNLAEYEESKRLYRTVYDSFPQSVWAPKALLAEAWILANVNSDSAAAREVMSLIIARYPDTDYADDSRRRLGLPVPKRKVEPAKPPTETLALRTDTLKPGPVSADTFASRADTLVTLGRWQPSREGRSRPGFARPPAETTRAPVSAETSEMPARKSVPETTRTEPARVRVESLEVVRFDFDRAEIRVADAEVLRRNAEWLKEYPDVKIVIVGYCDPRGLDEYNIGLGQKRAEAVRDFLVRLGIESSRLAVRSEGSRNTVSTGPAEYWLDRRVEFGRAD